MAKNGKLRGACLWLWRTRAGNRVLSLCPLALALAAVAVIRLFDLRLTGLLGACQFQRLTGWRCPGCGGTRMVEALLDGRIREAVYYNPFLFLLALLAAAFLLFMLLRTLRKDWKPIALNSNTAWWLLIPLFVVGFFVVRNTGWYQQWFY